MNSAQYTADGGCSPCEYSLLIHVPLQKTQAAGLLSTGDGCIEPKYGEDRRTETVRRKLEEDDAFDRVRADCIGRESAALVRVGSGRQAEHDCPVA
jgi:hypothetical protein